MTDEQEVPTFAMEGAATDLTGMLRNRLGLAEVTIRRQQALLLRIHARYARNTPETVTPDALVVMGWIAAVVDDPELYPVRHIEETDEDPMGMRRWSQAAKVLAELKDAGAE